MEQPPFRDLARRYLGAQLAGDRREAVRVIVEDGLGGGATVRQLLLDVVATAQYRVGELWAANQIGVADEHVATAVSQLVLSHLYVRSPRRPSNGRLVTIACVEGEQHDMGARVAADLLELEGFGVRMLGASVPIPSLLARLAAEPPDALLLSATMPHHLTALEATLARLRSTGAPPFLVLAGGQAVTSASGLLRELGVEQHQSEHARLASTIRQALAPGAAEAAA